MRRNADALVPELRGRDAKMPNVVFAGRGWDPYTGWVIERFIEVDESVGQNFNYCLSHAFISPGLPPSLPSLSFSHLISVSHTQSLTPSHLRSINCSISLIQSNTFTDSWPSSFSYALIHPFIRSFPSYAFHTLTFTDALNHSLPPAVVLQVATG